MSDGVSAALVQGLPAPEIIETLDYEAIFAEQRAEVEALLAAVGFDYTMGDLETDLVMIVLQAASTREMNMRARINDGARFSLIAFARGSDLDHRAAEYDVVRLPDETDERLRTRTWFNIAGRSPGGTEERYKAIALGVSLDVAETEIYRSGLGPQLEMAVLSTTNNGVPDQALLDAVSAALNVKKVQTLNDVIAVVSAVKVEVDVAIDVWLLPGADAAIPDRLPAVLTDAWADESGIGFDLNPGWITARAHLAGVARVVPTNPVAPLVAAKHEAISVRSVTVTFKGRQR